MRGDIISSYDGVYLLGFENETETMAAYTYYNYTAEFVEADIALFVADDSYTVKASPENNTDAFSQLGRLLDEDAEKELTQKDKPHYVLAVIDTGADDDDTVTSVSMLEDGSEDDNGHASAMLNAFRELSPDSIVLYCLLRHLAVTAQEVYLRCMRR